MLVTTHTVEQTLQVESRAEAYCFLRGFCRQAPLDGPSVRKKDLV
jgi:hypothetical protein